MVGYDCSKFRKKRDSLTLLCKSEKRKRLLLFSHVYGKELYLYELSLGSIRTRAVICKEGKKLQVISMLTL